MNRLKQSLAALPSFSSSNGERPTPPPLDDERLERLSTRREVAQNLHAAFASYHKTLAKERTNPTVEGTLGMGTVGIGGKGETKLPTRWVGEVMVEAAEQLANLEGDGDDEYRTSLQLVGEAHLELGDVSSRLISELGEGYLEVLEKRLDEFKDLEKLAKEADKKRTALESVMAKIEKGKKEKSEYEHDFDQAEWAYGDACESLTRKADQIENGSTQDVEALRHLIDAQLEHASNYTSILQSVRTRLPSPVAYSSSRSAAKSPNRSRSSTLQPPASTRMNRSLSDSSAQNVNLANSLLSSLGPGRLRRSTVSSQADDKEKDKETKNRSRSGSVLERFALGSGKKDKSKKSKDAKGENGGTDSPEADDEDTSPQSRSRSDSNTSNPSRFTPSMPSMPNVGSFKMFSSPSGSKYGTLKDSDTPPPRSPDFSSASPNVAMTSSSRRIVPPMLKRTQTAPPSSNPSSPTPSSPRLRVLSPLRPTFDDSPVGRTALARWAYHPSLADPDELEFDKGDLIRVEKEVSADWYIGKVVEGRHEGSRGMFPSAYVALQERTTASDSREEEETMRDHGWTGFGDDDRSIRSASTRTTSTKDAPDDGSSSSEDDVSRLRSETSRAFSPGRSAGPSAAANGTRPPPPPLPTTRRTGATTPKRQPPPPPPPRRTNSGSGPGLPREDEGSPFD
ncbi:hypothetical protein JCM10212_005953 [Sporobolomyces blumeae]